MNGHDMAASLVAYVAFGLLHAAAPERFAPAWAMKRSAPWKPSLRALAALAFAISCFLFSRREGWGAGSLSATFALSLSGCVVVLAAPLFPRAVWISMGAAPVLAVVALLR